LGFKVLGHQDPARDPTHTAITKEGDALMKQLTGAQTMAMGEDVPALQA